MGLGVNLGNMTIGTIIPLIPGVPFTNGLRDLANEDYLAGATRLLDALMLFFCIALGVCLTFISQSYIDGEMIRLSGTATDSGTSHLLVQLLSAFVGTSAFAVLFGLPRRHYVSSGFVGMAGWLIYLLIVRHTSLTVVGGTFFATLTVAFLSTRFAVWRRCPGTLFLICGIFPLIPGAGVFWSSYYIVSSQLHPALRAGLSAVKITVAIVLGVIIVTNIASSRRKKGCK